MQETSNFFLNVIQSVSYFFFFFLMKMKKPHGCINPPQKCDHIFTGDGDVLLDPICLGYCTTLVLPAKVPFITLLKAVWNLQNSITMLSNISLAWNLIQQWFHSRKNALLCNAVPGSPAPREYLKNGNWHDGIHMLKEGLGHAGVNMLVVLPKNCHYQWSWWSESRLFWGIHWANGTP